MPKKRKKGRTLPNKKYHGYRATRDGHTLSSWTVGALPIINHIIERMQLEKILQQHLPEDDPRLEVPTARCLLILVCNVLLSREPVYGVAEWAERYAPEHLGLTSDQLGKLNDDRIGRSLDRLFDACGPQLIMDLVRQVVREFDLKLDELHNDSTTVSVYGAYEDAGREDQRRGRPTAAITFGHSKARRPDLKQLLSILTISDDGGVPVYFTTASGNVTDDTTHQETWELLCQLTGRVDFLYVADCKLATSANLKAIAERKGRFISLLPRTRKEDRDFREGLAVAGAESGWQVLRDVVDDKGELTDRLRFWEKEVTSKEGFRLLWFHSRRKGERDQASRTRAIGRTVKALGELEERLCSPKTRFRDRAKVAAAVEEILSRSGGKAWVHAEIEEVQQVSYKQACPGRPGKDTKYVKQVRVRYRLSINVDQTQVTTDQASDGVFPLISNDREMTAEEILDAYKRQPIIEKRFSQFKTDFEVAPVYLHEISRIHSLMCIYFFVLLIQTLLERELRNAMESGEVESLPLYPEGRDCRKPTTRRLLDIFESVQRHELRGEEVLASYVTELTPVQRELLKLLRIPPKEFGH